MLHESKQIYFKINDTLFHELKCESNSGEGTKLFVELLGIKEEAIYGTMREILRTLGWVDSFLNEKIVFECSIPLK